MTMLLEETRTFLHVGCGGKRKDMTLQPFATEAWREVTLDIDPGCAPDIVDSLPDLALVPDGAFDAVFSSHNIEHLFAHEVEPALRAFRRVLKPDGVAIVTCPDLQCLGERLAKGDLDTPLYVSPAGPIGPLDILFGHRASVEAGNTFMAHRGGFTAKSLVAACTAAGFGSVLGLRRPNRYDIFVVATRTPVAEEELKKRAQYYLEGIGRF